MKKSSFAVAVGIVVLACASRGLAQTASLIDIAKAEEARRKAIAAPAKVITNIDLRPAVVGAPADTSPAVPAGDRPAESAPAVPSTPAAGAPPASATAESEQQNPASEQPKPPAEQPKPPTEQPKSPAEQ